MIFHKLLSSGISFIFKASVQKSSDKMSDTSQSQIYKATLASERVKCSKNNLICFRDESKIPGNQLVECHECHSLYHQVFIIV